MASISPFFPFATLSNTSLRRKCHVSLNGRELVVGVDGEGVNVYNLSTSSIVTSYPVPSDAMFMCPPKSVGSKESRKTIACTQNKAGLIKIQLWSSSKNLNFTAPGKARYLDFLGDVGISAIFEKGLFCVFSEENGSKGWNVEEKGKLDSVVSKDGKLYAVLNTLHGRVIFDVKLGEQVIEIGRSRLITGKFLFLHQELKAFEIKGKTYRLWDLGSQKASLQGELPHSTIEVEAVSQDTFISVDDSNLRIYDLKYKTIQGSIPLPNESRLSGILHVASYEHCAEYVVVFNTNSNLYLCNIIIPKSARLSDIVGKPSYIKQETRPQGIESISLEEISKMRKSLNNSIQGLGKHVPQLLDAVEKRQTLQFDTILEQHYGSESVFTQEFLRTIFSWIFKDGQLSFYPKRTTARLLGELRREYVPSGYFEILKSNDTDFLSLFIQKVVDLTDDELVSFLRSNPTPKLRNLAIEKLGTLTPSTILTILRRQPQEFLLSELRISDNFEYITLLIDALNIPSLVFSDANLGDVRRTIEEAIHIAEAIKSVDIVLTEFLRMAKEKKEEAGRKDTKRLYAYKQHSCIGKYTIETLEMPVG
ncbi:hypothetical protein NEOLI_004477 [Neolecta irregularis DAH-3]|uniref:Uncharacterized protein n=1 Tax=Neolecta irregularis (strain DAH-3) TaxID=1198029 RepID=A0A1U7LMX8_NEOID|nr:hypothetical protein NEOLI_004477 [Neolecta irregularis DAH-3]|eukprot:OLL23881.1 hypothetical protein NEOLI_004477 [Neolecta irregularis DAH-3]